jgi:mRNA interferase RelE/StbE
MDLEAISKKDLQRIIDRIDLLIADPQPQGCERFSGQERHQVRLENYRIVYWVFQRQRLKT